MGAGEATSSRSTAASSSVSTPSTLSTGTEGQDSATGPSTLPGALTETDIGRFEMDAEGGTYAFTSADGELECMFSAVDRPDAAVNGFPGGCSQHHPEEGDGPTVFMVTGPGRPGTFAQLGTRYPGHWYTGWSALEPGQFIDVGGQVACFSSTADRIGCLEYDTGQGYQLIGGQFHPFGPERIGEVFDVGDGTVQLLSRRVIFGLADGQELTCGIRAGVLACEGGTWEHAAAGGGASDILWFDAIGGASAPVGATPVPAADEAVTRAQRVGQGHYVMSGIRVENTGTRLIFTPADGSSFWLSADDCSGDPLTDPEHRHLAGDPEKHSQV